MKPMARRTGIGSSRTSWPATWTLPALAVSSVASTRSVVVLPAPLGPKMLRKPPRSRLKEMPFSTSRRPNVLRRPSTSISRGAALSCRSGESDMGHPPLGRGAVRAGGVAYGGVRFRDPRLLLLPAPARPQRDHSAGAEQDRADPHPADEWEDHRAQGDGLGRAVERLVQDHEEVLERPPEDHRANGGPTDRVDVGVRSQRADRRAVLGDVEVRHAAHRALSAGALVHRPVGKGVAVQAGGRAGLDLDDGRLLDLVD